MPTTRKSAAKKPARKAKAKSPAKRKKKSAAAGPLVDVARKIGTTLGEVAVRTGLVKPSGDEPSGQ